MNTKLRNRLYYFIRPVLSRGLQIYFRRLYVNTVKSRYRSVWPINQNAGEIPQGWKGWPNGKSFAFFLSHDVDTQHGHDNCLKIMELELELGFHSTYFFVPERYKVSPGIIQTLKDNGFGVGVHGLKHDGKLFNSETIFKKRAAGINKYLHDWGAAGFSSPSSHHNFGWMNELNISYATSSFDTDPFEPQPDGVNTIFPFFVKNASRQYLEMPYTLPQDFTLFVLMREKNIDTWKHKLGWIAKKGGMALLNTHPDYMDFSGTTDYQSYPGRWYFSFLKHVASKYHGQYLNILASEAVDLVKGC